jgi:glycosyltransferase involved in cell wall biosynthesis
MRILLVADAFTFGGMETQLAGMVRRLGERGHEVRLATGAPVPGGCVPEGLAEPPIDLAFPPEATCDTLLGAAERIGRVIERAGVTAVHAHPFLALTPALLASQARGVPLVCTMHGPASAGQAYGPVHELLVKGLVLPAAALTIGVSEEVLALAGPYVAASRSAVVRNGVDTERFAPREASGDRWLLLSRLDAAKIDGIVGLLRVLGESGLGSLDVVGDGPERAALERAVASMRLEARVRLRGLELDVAGLLAREAFAGIIGMGRVALEAASSDLPCLLLGYDGPKGLLDAARADHAAWWNFSGRGLPTLDSAGLRAELASLAHDPSPYRLREWVRERWDERLVWDRYEGLVSSAHHEAFAPVDHAAALIKAHASDPTPYTLNTALERNLAAMLLGCSGEAVKGLCNAVLAGGGARRTARVLGDIATRLDEHAGMLRRLEGAAEGRAIEAERRCESLSDRCAALQRERDADRAAFESVRSLRAALQAAAAEGRREAARAAMEIDGLLVTLGERSRQLVDARRLVGTLEHEVSAWHRRTDAAEARAVSADAACAAALARASAAEESSITAHARASSAEAASAAALARADHADALLRSHAQTIRAVRQAVADVRVSRRYKLSNVISALKARPVSGARIAGGWALDRLRGGRRGGLISRLSAPDPLWPAQSGAELVSCAIEQGQAALTPAPTTPLLPADAAALAFQIESIRISRRYKLSNLLSAFKRSPGAATRGLWAWALGGARGVPVLPGGPDPLLSLRDELRRAADVSRVAVNGQPASHPAGALARAGDPLADIIAAHPNVRGVIVYPPLIDWSWMKQRPHHLLTAFARAGYLVFFCSNKTRTDDFSGFHRVADRLYLCDDLNPLYTLESPIVLVSNPLLLPYVKPFKNPRVVYDFLDDLGIHGDEHTPRQEVSRAHERLLREAELVLVTADRLARQCAASRGDALVCPNAVDADHFRPAAPDATPRDLEPILLKAKPLVGYYGALAKWFDFELVEGLARLRPDLEFVLLGPDYDGAVRTRDWRGLDNLHWLGEKKYEELPAYLHAWSVATIPFLINDITLSTSPLKMFEYMAGGRPVVSTPLPECLKHDTVLIGRDAREFSAAIDRALELGRDPAYLSKLAGDADANTWAARTASIERRLFRPGARSHAFVLEHASRSRGVFVFPKSISWQVDLFQRPQHLARCLAQAGHTVVYDNSGEQADDFYGWKEIEPGLFLFRENATLLNDLPDPVLWTFCYNYPLRDGYTGPHRVIYDLIDDPKVHPFDPAVLEANHRRALEEADVTAYVARRLEPMMASRADALYLPNGVEFDRFATEPCPEPDDPELRRLMADGRPIAGYYGALAEWFDYELLEEVARLKPDWGFVLIGPDYDGSLAGKPVINLPNVVWLGVKKYPTLPGYLRCFDVATIPFLINDITLATSPLKLYEYVAGGKPVVTSPMPECMAYPEVLIADGSEAFAAALDRALELGRDPAFVERLRSLGRDNSWAARGRAACAALKAAQRRTNQPV